MRQADLFVLPSRWDNMPCVLVEAMASALPIVSTAVGGIPEIVSEETGVLVPPADDEALARGLSDAISRTAAFGRKQIADRAPERYSVPSIAWKLDQVYANAVRDCVGSVRPRVGHHGRGWA